MPFENVKREGRIFWLGEAAAVLLTDDLNALGADAITRDGAARGVRAAAGAAGGGADRRHGHPHRPAGRRVAGDRRVAADRGRRRSSSTRAASPSTPGASSADVTERGPLPELFATFERDRAAPRAGVVTPSADVEKQHPPVAVFENYIKGLLAETPATAITYLNAALARQPTFDRARLALWDVFDEQGDHARALAAVASVSRRFAVVAARPIPRRPVAAGPEEVRRRVRDLQGAGRRDADADGVQQPRRRPAAPRRHAADAGSRTYFFNKAAEPIPTIRTTSSTSATPTGSSATRRRRSTGCAKRCGAIRPTATRTSCSAPRSAAGGRRRRSARASASWRAGCRRRYETGQASRRRCRAEGTRARQERGRAAARAADRDARWRPANSAISDELARFYLDRGRRLFEQENDRDAVVELNRALYLSPYLAEAHLLLGRIHLRNGRVREAIDAFKISVWSAETAEAHAALGEAYRQAKDADAARAEAERALALDPASAEAQAAARAARRALTC